MLADGRSTEFPWWVVYTRHQHEKAVAGALAAKGHEVFLPLYASLRKWKDRRKTITLPLFPCYVFVRGAQDRRLSIVTTSSVHMMLTKGDAPAVVPEDEIEAIRRSLEGRMNIEPHPFLKCGQRVRVKHGVLEGVEGILVRVRNLFRLVLSVEILNQSVAVEIDASSVELVCDGKPDALVNGRFMQPVQEPDFAIGRQGGFATSAGIRILREPERGM
ncbi:MAG: UpxY family transcription antiterminator [Candidatus Korobacteraceae bacterium]|jgi:transcription antitermination factor NusG